MPGKCCCAPDINNAKNEILRNLQNQLPIKPQGLDPKNIDFSVDILARKIADLLYQPPSNFEADVLRQLAAIINALIAMKAGEGDRELLLLIARNTNDIVTQASANHRQTALAIANTATQAQAKDLLFAITESRRDLVRQIRQLADGIATRFVAIGAAIVALTATTVASKVAILTAIAASLARILTAIAGIRFPQPEKVDLSKIERDVSDLVRSKLSLEEFEMSVPSCTIGAGQIPTLTYTPVQSFALRDRMGNSAKTGDITLSQMLASLLVEGKLSCTSSESLSSEDILDQTYDGTGTGVFAAYPSTLSAYWFTLEITDIDEEQVRTYKLAGLDSEYGAGNWSVIDGGGRACQRFSHIYVRNLRLDVPVRGGSWGIRVSPKPGVSFRVVAHGKPFS